MVPINRTIAELPLLGPAVISAWRMFRDPYFEPTTDKIAKQLPWHRQQTIVHIGANDGKRGDPIYDLIKSRRRWRGLFVEPLPEFYKMLVSNLGSSKRFMFEQSAIGSEPGFLSFFHMDATAEVSPHWRPYFDRIGSLDRQVVMASLGDRAKIMERFIIESKVTVMTLDQLLCKWDINHVDCLVVDAEGYDWQIVKQALVLGLEPKVIFFEHVHLNHDEHNEAVAELARHYQIEKVDELNYLCVRWPRQAKAIVAKTGSQASTPAR